VGNDHVQVPEALVPDFTIVPTEADRVTVSPGFESDHVPLLPAVWPSPTVTDALFLATTGAELTGAVE
jgi:hypothetical protein